MYPQPAATAETSLDDLLEPCFAADDPFDWWAPGRDAWWASLAQRAVPEMLAISPLLRGVSQSGRPAPGRVEGPAAPYRDLLVPSAVFKRGLPVSEAKDVVGCSSSGTRGSVSTVPRDDATLERFFSGVRTVVRVVTDLRTSGFSMISLVPSISAPKAPWTSYIVAGMGAAHQMTEPGATPPAKLLADEAALNDRTMLVGAPYDVLDFAEAAGRSGPWSDRLLVLTVGGWKRSERQAISPAQLRSRVSAAIGVDPRDIRDGYSMVEINTVLLECAQHRKHIPPWLEVAVLSPRYFEPAPAGTEGMLAYFDPTVTSFPGFILSEDVGVRHDEPCPCGLPGPSLTGVRRMTSVEVRGCALASAPRASAARPVLQAV
jgi:long-chain-fatty-acid---luciferin-component ligase